MGILNPFIIINDEGRVSNRNEQVKEQVLKVLQHSEAEDGLYFRNFYSLHEEDDRPVVQAEQHEILEALRELIEQGKVAADESGPEVIFTLIK